MRKNKLLFPVILLIIAGIVFFGCKVSDPDPIIDVPDPVFDAAWTIEQKGGADGTATTTHIIINFDKEVNNLPAENVAVSGAVAKGDLAKNGNSWEIAVTVFTQGNVDVTISNVTGVESGTKSLLVYKKNPPPNPVNWTITANGTTNTETTTKITVTFEKDITGLTAGEVTLTNNTAAASMNSVTEVNAKNWELNVTVTKQGLVKVKIDHVNVDSGEKEIEVYFKKALPTGRFSDNARRLLNFLEDEYGNRIVSGQMDTAWTENNSMDMIARVFTDTGKYPALKGFDMMELPYNWTNYGRNQINEAVEWWEGKNKMNGASPAAQLIPGKRGIVAFCWHWRMPAPTGTGMYFYTTSGSSTDYTNFRIPWKDGELDTESADFQRIKSDLDKAAALLQILKSQDIPVLWRPLHEASGGWFWWGAKDVTDPAKRFIALWEYMYDYLTNEKDLNNLIWVWNGQHNDWYPNPDTVDIVGFDYYTNSSSQSTAQNYNSQSVTFNNTQNMVPLKDRIVALTENGAIPDPDKCRNDNAMWSWFMVWNDSNNTVGQTNKNNFWTGEYHNTQTHKEYVYNHDLVITLDKLPDITAYRLE
jgi:mannan endo-1,4-beta-mannosidase